MARPKIQINPLDAVSVPLASTDVVSLDGIISSVETQPVEEKPAEVVNLGPSLKEQKQTVVVPTTTPKKQRVIRILEDASFFIRGQSIRLRKGQVRRVDGLPPGTVEGYIASGVKLVEEFE